MKFYEKISKSGMFSDKAFEHYTIKAMLAQNSLAEFNRKSEVDVEVNYFYSPIIVDVAEYEDGIVRLRAYLGIDVNKQYEIGRMLISKPNFLGNMNYLTDNVKE